VRISVKKRLVYLDARYLNSSLRLLYHGQGLPVLPEGVPEPAAGQYAWLGSGELIPIAHGLGPQLYNGPNTRATMIEGLRLGFKIFEVDLALTADGYLICYHGAEGEDLDKLTFAQYLEKMHQINREPYIFSNLVKMVRQLPGIKIVLDVKNRFDDAYKVARHEIGDRALGKSFIPQIYYFEQIYAFRQDQFYSGEIYTSYRSALTTEQIFNYARKLKIRAVTLTLDRFDEITDRVPSDLVVMVHPVNDPYVVQKIKQLGGRGIYTSYLPPHALSQIFAGSAHN